MTVRRHELRLVPVALAAWAAAAVATLAEAAAPTVAVATGVGCVLTLVVLGRSARARTALLVAALALAAASASAAAVGLAAAERDAVRALDVGGGRALELEVRVVGKVERTERGWRFDAILTVARIGGVRSAQTAPVRVLASEAPAGLDVGVDAVIDGTAFAPTPPDRAVLVVVADGIAVRAPPGGVLAAASALRAGLVARTARLPDPGGGLIAGLAVGDTSAVAAQLDADMKTTALAHLTAVSGANCALVVGIAFAVAAVCGARRSMRVAVGVATLAGFVVLVTPEPSVVRAAAMAAIAMIALLLGRRGAGIATLSLAATVILIVDPWLSSSLGFALSVAATGGLLVLAGPLADVFARRMPRPLALAIAVPLAAQIACGPLLILVQPAVPLHGVLANILAGPAAPLGTVLGLVACLTAGIPLVGATFASAAWVPAAWVAGTAQVLADVPGGTVPWPEGLGGALLLAGVGAAGVVAMVVSRRRARIMAIAVLCVAAGALVGAGPVATAVDRMRTPGDWTVVACDVGQGDAVLLRSAGVVALVDAGPEPEALTRCLDRFGVDRIALFVLTHFDADHRGGVDAVVGRVDRVLHGPVPADGVPVLESLRAGGAELVPASADVHGALGEETWRVLWPVRPDTMPGNDASVVVEAGGAAMPRTLLLGDLSAEPQLALAPRLEGTYDIVKVAHHGSADQARGLYERARPALALVTVGENDYGHPRAEILDALDAGGARVLRTDQDGAVVVWREDGALRVWRAGR